MQSNETFRLLNLSSESLSDLELQDSVNFTQRKRKTRRKTRPKVTSNVPPKKPLRCKNFGLYTALVMISGWLLIVSYILSVIHTEYRRLEIELQKVSATTQHVPEALQKWHETTKYLEQNQTNISLSLAVMQENMKLFNNDIKLLQQRVEQKNENSQESQVKGLQESLATIGSKIQDFSSRIEKLENDYVTLRTGQGLINATVSGIDMKMKNTSPTITVADNTTRQRLEDVNAELSAQIKNLSLNVTGETTNLKAQLGFLMKDFGQQKNKTDSLMDQTLNISSTVSSIENLYTTKLSTQLSDLEGRTNNLTATLKQAQTQFLIYANQYDAMAHDVQEIRGHLIDVAASAKPAAASEGAAKMFPLPSQGQADSVQSFKSPNKSVIPQNITKVNPSSTDSKVSTDSGKNTVITM